MLNVYVTPNDETNEFHVQLDNLEDAHQEIHGGLVVGENTRPYSTERAVYSGPRMLTRRLFIFSLVN